MIRHYFTFAALCLALLVGLSACDSSTDFDNPEPRPVDGPGDDDPDHPDNNAAPLPADMSGDALVVNIDPTSTYLHVAKKDVAGAPLIINLKEHGVAWGDTLNIARVGEWRNRAEGPDPVSTGMMAVFSRSGTLTAEKNRYRVPSAVAATLLEGNRHETEPTSFGNEPTDIPEDFYVLGSGMRVIVPNGGDYLFVGVPDIYYRDNRDMDNDYRLVIRF